MCEETFQDPETIQLAVSVPHATASSLAVARQRRQVITVVESRASRKEPLATEGLSQAVSAWERLSRASRAGVALSALCGLSGAGSQERQRLTAAEPPLASAAAGLACGRLRSGCLQHGRPRAPPRLPSPRYQGVIEDIRSPLCFLDCLGVLLSVDEHLVDHRDNHGESAEGLPLGSRCGWQWFSPLS